MLDVHDIPNERDPADRGAVVLSILDHPSRFLPFVVEGVQCPKGGVQRPKPSLLGNVRTLGGHEEPKCLGALREVKADSSHRGRASDAVCA